jgi:hypothetical protein
MVGAKVRLEEHQALLGQLARSVEATPSWNLWAAQLFDYPGVLDEVRRIAWFACTALDEVAKNASLRP